MARRQVIKYLNAGARLRHNSDATGQTKEGLLQDVRIVSNLDLSAGTMSL
jgi:hypothetical protein